MKKICGMTALEWSLLGKALNKATMSGECAFCTVEEYIDRHPGCVTSRRVSKSGTEMVEVTYPTGKVAEYPLSHISTTTAFEY